MNSFQKDETDQEVLLSKNNHQVMMEWEKPYMEAAIDMLNPIGHVLEIGFGCGYSATQIIKYKPKSYTVIECDSVVSQRAKEWREIYHDIPINIIEGRWQEKLHELSIFDEIYFDDYPLDITKETKNIEKLLSQKRIGIFLDICIQNHTRVGSRISWYLAQNPEKISFSSDTEPFITSSLKTLEIDIPNTCKYRNLKEQKCTIPLIEKVKNFCFKEAQEYALKKIKLDKAHIIHSSHTI